MSIILAYVLFIDSGPFRVLLNIVLNGCVYQKKKKKKKNKKNNKKGESVRGAVGLGGVGGRRKMQTSVN
jgi:hypothetical protein